MTTTEFVLTIIPSIERSIEELRGLLAPIRQGSGPDVLDGGRLGASLGELIDLSQAELTGIIVELEQFLAAHSAAVDAAAAAREVKTQ